MSIDTYHCDRCGGYGIWLTPKGLIAECPNYQLRLNNHPAPGAAAQSVLTAGYKLAARLHTVLTQPFDIARALTRGTTTRPIDRDYLITKYVGTGGGSLRRFHHVIEELRAVWHLPVASRKDTPHGYWIATDVDDFREWVARAKSAPISQLSTIHAVAKANFPVFAEQLELEFWSDMETGDRTTDFMKAATPKSTS